MLYFANEIISCDCNISNPIGIKCGPSLDADELQELVVRLNPGVRCSNCSPQTCASSQYHSTCVEREPGRLTLITRYGADKVKDLLPGHIEAIKNADVMLHSLAEDVACS